MTTQDAETVFQNMLSTPVASSRKIKERRKEQREKWKSFVGIFGGKGYGKTFAQTTPGGVTRHPIFNAAKNPFDTNTAAGIAWEVSKTGGVVDPGVMREAVKQGFPASALNPTQPTTSASTLAQTNLPKEGLHPSIQSQGYTSTSGGTFYPSETYYYPSSPSIPTIPNTSDNSHTSPYTSETYYRPPISSGTSIKIKPKEKEYAPEEIGGMFCAYVIAKVGGAQHTGVLFVKKCGYWKILEPNGHKVAGGGVGTFEDMVRSGELKLTVILTIYSADRVETTEDMDLEIT